MVLIGCTPATRHTEQHDVFFGISETIKELVPTIRQFWPDGGKLHLDAYREVNQVNGYHVSVVPKINSNESSYRLFFLNLGGYKPNEFEEFHYKMIVVAPNKGEAVKQAKETAFYKHTGFGDANSHIDDKYGVDVDDVYEITDILPPHEKAEWNILVEPGNATTEEDELYLGYFKLDLL